MVECYDISLGFLDKRKDSYTEKKTKVRLQIRTLTVSIGGGALKEMGIQLDKAGTRYAKGPRQINLAVALTSLNWTHLKEN